MKNPVVFIFIIIILKSFAQEPVYFNNIYKHENNFAIGMTILETEGGYVGYGGTEDPNNIGQMLLLYKMDAEGNELIWKSFGENYYSYYYGNVGGAMINTNDGNYALACHYGYGVEAFGTLIKLNSELDTIWQKHFQPAYKTVIVNCFQTNDNGYILTGWVWQSEEDWSDVLLLKTDSLGNYLWHQLYDDNLAEKGSHVIQTPDGGYLVGGFTFNPPEYHSHDAMVIKTDSLGIEEWTKYYGNPDVDDDMAFVAMADDGNYLVTTVFGEWIHTPMIRTGKVYLMKIDNEGNTIWDKKIGPKRRSINIKNIRLTSSGGLVATGWSYTDTISEWTYDGWIYKFTQEGDSIWFRDYYHFHDQYDLNFFYDASPTKDKGYIAIGKSRPGEPGNTDNMWIVKVDSMGCDTPGCFTTVISEEWLVKGEGKLRVWPNPTKNKFEVWSSEFKVGGTKIIRIYNSQGLKVEEIKVSDNMETSTIDFGSYNSGLYFIQLVIGNKIVGSSKILKK